MNRSFNLGGGDDGTETNRDLEAEGGTSIPSEQRSVLVHLSVSCGMLFTPIDDVTIYENIKDLFGFHSKSVFCNLNIVNWANVNCASVTAL